jgi:hypothetical protein
MPHHIIPYLDKQLMIQGAFQALFWDYRRQDLKQRDDNKLNVP